MLSKSGSRPVINGVTENNSAHLNRRRWRRLRVHWPLQFHGEPGVETVTDDLSSDGFFCVAQTPFIPGEVRSCTLSVPAYHPDDVTRRICVHCRVRIVRVEALGKDSLFGVGCCIEEYRVHSFPDSP
jgi:hypothetical protein